MEHLGVCAEHPKALADWYVNCLGFRIVRVVAEHNTYFIRAKDGSMLEVYPNKDRSDEVDNVHQGLCHIALSVTDLSAEVERLRSSGVVVPVESLVITPEMKLAFFRDPEGNLLHLVERAEEIP